MAGIIPSLALLGYILFIKRLSRWPVEIIPVFTVSLVVSLSFLGGLFGQLNLISTTLLWAGITSLLAAPFYLPRSLSQLLDEYFTPGLIILAFFLTLFGLMATHIVTLIGWDEIARWLPMAKMMYLHHGLMNAKHDAMVITYPPGGALFYYFMLRLSPFNEGTVAYAHLFFILAPLVIVLQRYHWKQFADASLVFIGLILIMMLAFNVKLGPTGSAYMDVPAGLYFGSLLAAYFAFRQNKVLWLYLSILSFCIPLFKPMLMPFVIVAMTVMLFDQVLLIRAHKSHPKQFFLLFPVIAFALLASRLWAHYVNMQASIPQRWSLHFIHETILNKTNLVTNGHVNAILTTYVSGLVKPILFVLVMSVIVGILWRSFDKLNRKRLLWSQGWMLAGFIAYLFLLSFFYLYFVSSHIALTLNSFDRFNSIFYVAWMLMTSSQALYLTPDATIQKLILRTQNKIKYAGIITALFALMLYASMFIIHTQKKFNQHTHAQYERYMMSKIIEKIDTMTPHHASFAILWKGQGSLEPSMLGYRLIPRRSNVTLNPDMPIQSLRLAIKQYQYLIIGGFNQGYIEKLIQGANIHSVLSYPLKTKGQVEEIQVYLVKLNKR